MSARQWGRPAVSLTANPAGMETSLELGCGGEYVAQDPRKPMDVCGGGRRRIRRAVHQTRPKKNHACVALASRGLLAHNLRYPLPQLADDFVRLLDRFGLEVVALALRVSIDEELCGGARGFVSSSCPTRDSCSAIFLAKIKLDSP